MIGVSTGRGQEKLGMHDGRRPSERALPLCSDGEKKYFNVQKIREWAERPFT